MGIEGTNNRNIVFGKVPNTVNSTRGIANVAKTKVNAPDSDVAKTKLNAPDSESVVHKKPLHTPNGVALQVYAAKLFNNNADKITVKLPATSSAKTGRTLLDLLSKADRSGPAVTTTPTSSVKSTEGLNKLLKVSPRTI